MRLSLLALLLPFSVPLVPAPAQLTLVSPGCQQEMNGFMFDVVATEDVRICRIDLCLPAGLTNVEIHTRMGTHVGHETNPGSWTPRGVAERVVSRDGTSNLWAGDELTRIPLTVQVDLLQGQRLAFYVRSAGRIAVNGAPSPGGLLGTNVNAGGVNVITNSNFDLEVYWGTRLSGSFSGPQQGWSPAHRIVYERLPTTSACAGLVPYQRNASRSRLLTNNRGYPTDGDGFSPSTTRMPPGRQEIFFFEAEGGAGMLFDVVFNLSDPVPAGQPGSVVTTGGQVLNLDVTDPSTFSVFGGPPGTWQTMPPSPFPFAPPTVAFPFLPPVPVDVSAVGVIGDPTSPDGFGLSETHQVVVSPDCVNGPASPLSAQGTVLTLGDDDSVPFTPGFPITFFGMTYTELHVGSNGHVTFEQGQEFGVQGGSVAFVPPIIAGYSADLDPTAGGQIRAETNGSDLIRIIWDAVPVFSQTETLSFAVTYDASCSLVAIDYTNSWATGGTVGVSSGNQRTIATQVDYSLAGPGTPLPLDRWKSPFEQFDPAGTFTSGFDLANKQLLIQLDPDGFPVQAR